LKGQQLKARHSALGLAAPISKEVMNAWTVCFARASDNFLQASRILYLARLLEIHHPLTVRCPEFRDSLILWVIYDGKFYLREEIR
jgi:hypothetical protein